MDSNNGVHLGTGQHENAVDFSSHAWFSGPFQYVKLLVRSTEVVAGLTSFPSLGEAGDSVLVCLDKLQ